MWWAGGLGVRLWGQTVSPDKSHACSSIVPAARAQRLSAGNVFGFPGSGSKTKRTKSILVLRRELLLVAIMVVVVVKVVMAVVPPRAVDDDDDGHYDYDYEYDDHYRYCHDC